jgi:hypothetical protein
VTAIRLGVLGVPLGSLAFGTTVAATLLLAGNALTLPQTTASADLPSLLPLAEPLTTEEPAIEPLDMRLSCNDDDITTVIVHGQFTSLAPMDHFAIQLPTKIGTLAAITDSRGYFEMRIPRENVANNLCALDRWHSFSDEQMTLHYFITFE